MMKYQQLSILTNDKLSKITAKGKKIIAKSYIESVLIAINKDNFYQWCDEQNIDSCYRDQIYSYVKKDLLTAYKRAKLFEYKGE